MHTNTTRYSRNDLARSVADYFGADEPLGPDGRPVAGAVRFFTIPELADWDELRAQAGPGVPVVAIELVSASTRARFSQDGWQGRTGLWQSDGEVARGWVEWDANGCDEAEAIVRIGRHLRHALPAGYVVESPLGTWEAFGVHRVR